ncbi:hypothetical protein BVX93_02135, partial [bacterium B13(2017)]
LVYHSYLLDKSYWHIPGIYLVTVCRQVGQTTFLKQLILKFLKKNNINPNNILFLTGEIIDSHHELRRLINEFYKSETKIQYLFVDEINYIKDWDKTIKFLADAGFFEHMSVILTGSDSQIIRLAMKRFAGRRGKADEVDFNFYPLSFKEYVCLKDKKLKLLCNEISRIPIYKPDSNFEKNYESLSKLMLNYLIHGGYLPAIADYENTNDIKLSTFNTYIQWIIGDILKYNKSENYLFEILRGVKATYNSQMSWNSLARHLSIDHHKTISDYCHLLESIHVLIIQEAIIEHKLIGAPKKNRKIYFKDPFIDHSVTKYLTNKISIPQLKEQLRDNNVASHYVEAIVIEHCKRYVPTYYIKGEKGEVDIAIVHNNKMHPIEIKWTNALRPQDLKQIKKYNNGIILTKQIENKKIDQMNIVSLIRFLLCIENLYS